MRNFIALDVETANPSRDSICAIAVVKFEEGVPVSYMQTLVDPECEFHYLNTRIHSITQEMVVDSPTWDQVYPLIVDYIGDSVLVSHNASFDRSCFNRTSEKYGLPALDPTWVCTVKSSKRVLGLDSNTLPKVAAHLGITGLRHHDAGSDAEACGLIAVELSDPVYDALGVSRGFSSSTGEPKDRPSAVNMDDSEGFIDLAGETIVVTGEMALFSRAGIQEFIKSLGGKSPATVSKKTTLVVVGPGAGKKREQAEALGIPMMTEQEFASMVTVSDAD